MSLQPRLAALLAVLVLVSSTAPAPAGATQQTPDSWRDVAVTPLPPVAESDGRFGIVQGIQAADLADQAGARWDRVIFPWSLIQKDGPDSWSEHYFSDAALRDRAARGVTLAGVMIYTPQWASITPVQGRPVDLPQGLNLPYNDPKNHWGQFVRKLAARHKGVVDHWYVWNEQDLFDPAIRYTWEGSYEEYLQLLKVAYLNIKEVNPQAKVITGGFAYWYDKEYERPPYLGPLLELMTRDPEAPRNNYYFDIVDVHTYSAPLNSYAVPLIMKEIMDIRGLKKPIWISESNAIPYDDPRNPLPYALFGVTLDQQASYVIQSMALAVAAGVERYAIYKMIDEAPENAAEVYGLARDDRSIKPAYVAYQVGATYFSNVRSAVYSWPGSSEVPTPAEVKSVLTSNDKRTQFIWPAQVSQVAMERGNRRTTVVWNNSPSQVTYQVPAAARRATLVTKYGKTEAIAARDGFYPLDLPGSSHNTDRRDWSIYMTGGDPFIIDEQVAPLPTDRVASRIEVVWPHGSAPQREASKANVTAQLLMPGANESVPCRYNPQSVQLWRRVNNGPRELVTAGTRRFATADGITYPAWDFSDVDVSMVRGGAPSPGAEATPTPTTEPPKDSIEFSVVVDGVQTDVRPWIYGGPNANDWQQRPVRPTKSCE